MSTGDVSATAFSSNDRDVMERDISASPDVVVSREDLNDFFDLPHCAEFVQDGNYSKVALQFPDTLLCHATAVVARLSDLVPSCQLFVLADTSYGSCCVDEVAADHVSAQAVIHFGHTCLSSVRRLPVLYSFGREVVDVDACATSFRETFPDASSRVLMMCDTLYESSLDTLSSKLRNDYPQLVIAQIVGQQVRSSDDAEQLRSSYGSCLVRRPEQDRPRSEAADGKSSDCSATTPFSDNRHTRCGREFVLADGSSVSDYSVFYLGIADMALNNHMMTFSRSPFYLYDPRQSSPSAELQTAKANRSLKRRYVMMLKAKEAQTVGLLAGTLGVADYMAVMRRLKQVMKQAGKKVYTFSLGKLNVAKLANFPEVDVFVLVACPESTLISSEDFYKPVVTPYEMEVACVRSREWTGDYVTDFRMLLPGAAYFKSTDENGDGADEEPEFSLISGGLLSRPRDQEEVYTGSQALTTRSDGQVATLDAGAAFLASRSWSGLDPQLGQTAVADEVVLGRRGIAMSYTHEPGSEGVCCRQTAAAAASGCCTANAGGGCCQAEEESPNNTQ